ncbi:N-acetylneuraminate synthase [Acetobacterium wieringae]|uniref:N,N'-diacetyllegionaminic acid synthase n=1 Tax=Acetobacterium wieringae TaxID=52694 RepID=A0A1F2PF77_9FIRM|nr:N-acetylneuraminate synthase [Acetobacterium wieringae]OFV70017.1 N,N'-diacetyllegionaminic acid synthase [Acetobacterium wieringae]
MKNTYIIAEAGVNHNGNIVLAKKMIEIASKAGANAIKFQTFKAEKLVTKYARKALYQEKNSRNSETQLEMLKKLVLTEGQFLELKDYCAKLDLDFLSTPFDFESVDFLFQIGISQWKIPSGEITNLPYLIKIAETKLPIILSTGMATLDEVAEAVAILKKYGSSEITLLHCTTEYPAPFDEVNLRAMLTMREEFNLPIGYSDHTMGIEIPIAAVAMGATIIEKHFTLDRSMDGPDHQASLEPDELKQMVCAIRHVEKAFGDGIKQPAESEKKNIQIARKSIVAETKIEMGDAFTKDNLTIKRPGDGISPMKWFEVLGKRAARDFEEDELIEL